MADAVAHPPADASVVDAKLKRLSVPQYTCDATRHDKYLEDLRGHLHLLPEAPYAIGFKHDFVLHGLPRRYIVPPVGHNDPGNPVLPVGNPNAGLIFNPLYPLGLALAS